jgi:hypothetical protein
MLGERVCTRGIESEVAHGNLPHCVSVVSVHINCLSLRFEFFPGMSYSQVMYDVHIAYLPFTSPHA